MFLMILSSRSFMNFQSQGPQICQRFPQKSASKNDAPKANNNKYKNRGENAQEKVIDAPFIPPKGKSIAHKNFEAGEAHFLLLHVETGVDFCGIIQLSSQIFCITPPSSTTNTPKIITTIEDLFNKHVNPLEGAIWSQHTNNAYGILLQTFG